MKDELPDIAKRAARVAATIEAAVTRFSRAHRYAAGADLRNQARAVVRATHVAWHDRQRKLQHVHELSRAVDDYRNAPEMKSIREALSAPQRNAPRTDADVFSEALDRISGGSNER